MTKINERKSYTSTLGAITPQAHKKIAILAHNDKNKKIANYIVHLCKSLYEWDCAVFLISTCESLADDEINKIKPYTSEIIIRSNQGYDFGSYCIGYDIAKRYTHCDYVLFINDSVFGPLSPLKNLDHYLNQNWDVLGMTDHLVGRTHYLNGYFLLVRSYVLNQPQTMNFFENYTFENDKISLICNYEMKIFQDLKRYSLCPYQKLVQLGKRAPGQMIFNEALKFWKEYIQEFNCPFVKRKIFKEEFENFNPLDVDKKNEFQGMLTRGLFFNPTTDLKLLQKDGYDINLIYDYYRN